MSCGCNGTVKVSTRGATGPAGSCIPIVETTYAALAALQTAGTLVPATIYFITDKNVYLQALTATGLDTVGVVKGINADYNNVTTNFIGVWTGTTQLYYNNLVGSFTTGEIVTGGTSGAQGEIILKVAVNNLGYRIAQVISKNGIAFTPAETITGASSGATGTVSTVTTTTILGTIAINKIIAWNNTHYKNTTGSASIIHPKYDTVNWTELALTDASYQIEYDKITYNFATATITGREDKRGNVVIDKETAPNSVTKFQWGRDAVFGNNIFSFSFEGWNAATANTNLLIQDGGFYIGDTAQAKFTQSTGRSTVVMIGPSDCQAAKVFHGSALTLTDGFARHAYVENFGDLTVYASGADGGDSVYTNCSCILTGTSQILGCKIDGGATSITKNFASENHSNKVYIRDSYSTFAVALSQTNAAAALTLDTSLFYGIYNLTITVGTATLTNIVNMPTIMPVTVNMAVTSTYGAIIQHTLTGPIQLKGYGDKLLSPGSRDWITFQTIQNVNQEVNSSLGDALPVLNTTYVSKSGNDTTGVINRFDRPFLTITAAQAVTATDSTIIIYPGIYTENGLGKSGVNYHFMNGAILAATTGNGFVDTAGISYSITGEGELTCTSGNVILFNSGGVLTVSAKRLGATTGNCINTASTSSIYATIQKEIVASAGRCFQMNDTSSQFILTDVVSAGGYTVGTSAYAGTYLYLRADTISASGSTAFDLGGNASVYGKIFYTGNASGIVCSAGVACSQNFYGDINSSTAALIMEYTVANTGTINLYGKIISTGPISISGSTATFNFYNEIQTNLATTPSISMTSGTVKIINTRITNLDANAASYGITKTTGTLVLQNAVIITGAGSAPSVYSAAAQNYKVLGTLACNVAPSVNLTDITGGVVQVDVDVQ
jgi:hypothetical protein